MDTVAAGTVTSGATTCPATRSVGAIPRTTCETSASGPSPTACDSCQVGSHCHITNVQIYSLVWSEPVALAAGRPYITSMCQVACPVELYSATGIHRLDEPTTSYACGTVISGGGNLNRMMDCGKPSFAWKGSAKGTTYTYIYTFIKHGSSSRYTCMQRSTGPAVSDGGPMQEGRLLPHQRAACVPAHRGALDRPHIHSSAHPALHHQAHHAPQQRHYSVCSS